MVATIAACAVERNVDTEEERARSSKAKELASNKTRPGCPSCGQTNL